METPQRYWSGLYWDGIDPEQLGAVSLSDASGDGDAAVDRALADVRAALLASGEKVDDFCVSLIEMGPTQHDVETHLAAAEKEMLTDTSVDASAPSPSAASSPSAALPSFAPRSVCGGDCLVVRLWHMDVFLGARESAQGDPGARCRDVHCDPLDGHVRHTLRLEDTDALMEEQEQ